MLVLSRKEEQEIVVDQRIKITVLQVRGNRVRIGIEAPPEVSIRRSEIEPFESVQSPAAVVTLEGIQESLMNAN